MWADEKPLRTGTFVAEKMATLFTHCIQSHVLTSVSSGGFELATNSLSIIINMSRVLINHRDLFELYRFLRTLLNQSNVYSSRGQL